MEQTGEYRIAARRQLVWEGLNDPDMLARCIAGCQSMTKSGDHTFQGLVKAKVGPVSATFSAEFELTDINAPQSYVINASVKGGQAGFGKGQAKVELQEADAETLLQYQASANVGGKLAQIGSRLIDAAARKMADDFFRAFTAEMAADAAPAAAELEPDAQPQAALIARQWPVWAVVFALLVVTLVLVW